MVVPCDVLHNEAQSERNPGPDPSKHERRWPGFAANDRLAGRVSVGIYLTIGSIPIGAVQWSKG